MHFLRVGSKSDRTCTFAAKQTLFVTNWAVNIDCDSVAFMNYILCMLLGPLLPVSHVAATELFSYKEHGVIVKTIVILNYL